MSAVLAVVLMVLKIIGMILLALLLLLLLALLLPAGIHFRWSHIGGLRLQLCYGPLHFTLYPRKADEEKKKAEPKAETKQGNTPKTEPTSAAPPKPTPPPAKAELPAQPTMEKQTETTEAKPAKAPEEPQKAEPAPPAEKEQGKPKAPEKSPQPEQAAPKPKAKSAPASQPGAAAAHAPAAETEPQPEEDTGLVDRIKAAVRADPVGYVRHLFSVLRASVGPLLRGFRVSKLNVIWTITGETAAETAILYDQTLTTLNTILAIAQDHIKIQADQLRLEADYTGSAKQQRVVSFKLLLCPLLALVTVVWRAWHDPQLLPPKHPKYNTPETEQGGNL